MPNLLQIGPYRIYFWSLENGEPPHVHVKRDRSKAKFWLLPVVKWKAAVASRRRS